MNAHKKALHFGTICKIAEGKTLFQEKEQCYRDLEQENDSL